MTTAKDKTSKGASVESTATAKKIAAAYSKEFPNGGRGEKNLEAAKYASDAKTIKPNK